MSKLLTLYAWIPLTPFLFSSEKYNTKHLWKYLLQKTLDALSEHTNCLRKSKVSLLQKDEKIIIVNQQRERKIHKEKKKQMWDNRCY